MMIDKLDKLIILFNYLALCCYQSILLCLTRLSVRVAVNKEYIFMDVTCDRHDTEQPDWSEGQSVIID